jgi:ABC-type glycerol-3-phosphate transport system substrate-binding protein
MKRIVIVLAVAASAVGLAGCGGDDGDVAETTEPAVTTTAATETETAPETETTVETTPAKPKPTTVTIRVVGGVPQGGIARPKVKKGDRVVIVVRSDAGEAVHMHGYDLERPITPGKPVRLPLTATIPGRFEVELHHPDALLAVLTVNP